MTWIGLFWKFSAHATYLDAIVSLIMHAAWFILYNFIVKKCNKASTF